MLDLFPEPAEIETRLIVAVRAKQRRDEVKAAGGAEYEALLARERAQVAERRARLGRQPYDRKKESEKFKVRICARARCRARKRGFEATIRPEDLVWPSHCPVLGIELAYPADGEKREGLIQQPNWPSLDRWDNTKGYMPGNVFVISTRANMLKSSGTYEEILRVAKYLAKRPT